MQWISTKFKVKTFAIEHRYPGISEQEGGAVEGKGFGGCLEAPSGSKAKPWWAFRGRSFRKLTDFCM
jgi:hypothetical protein